MVTFLQRHGILFLIHLFRQVSFVAYFKFRERGKFSHETLGMKQILIQGERAAALLSSLFQSNEMSIAWEPCHSHCPSLPREVKVILKLDHILGIKALRLL